MLSIFAALSLAVLPVLGEDGAIKEELDGLILELGHKKWTVREKAESEIAGLLSSKGDQAVCAAAEKMASSADPEVKKRLERVLLKSAPECVREGRRGFLGVNLAGPEKAVKAGDTVFFPLLVSGVVPESAAGKAGFMENDRILSVDDVQCRGGLSVEDMVLYISSRGEGSVVKVMRLAADGKVRLTQIKLEARPFSHNDRPLPEIKKQMFEEWLRTMAGQSGKKLSNTGKAAEQEKSRP